MGHSAGFDDDEAVGEDDRVDRIVGDEQPGAGEGGEVAAQLGPHLHSGTGIQSSERLVEQQQPRSGGERAGQSDPLRLPARQGARLGAGVFAQSETIEPAASLGPGLGLGVTTGPQAEGDVVQGGQTRKEEVVLEHHTDGAFGRGDEHVGAGVVEDSPIQHDASGVDRMKACDGAQRSGLAGTVRAQQRDHLAVVDRELEFEVELPEADLDVGAQHSGSGREPAVAER